MSKYTEVQKDNAIPKAASAATVERNRILSKELRLKDEDFDLASRGFIATHSTGVIEGPFGTAWDVNLYNFVDRDTPAPETINPSLWRQAQLNNNHGLFKVDEGLWQVRGYDLANITFIEGDTGWIIIDPLTTTVSAQAALALANEHLGERQVRAVIYTHSHTDHYGGMLGVTTQEAVDAKEVAVIAPEGFMREITSESLMAGPAASQRASYQFGIQLDVGPTGQVDAGLGMGVAKAPAGLIAPTIEIGLTGEEHLVDGVRIVFQNTPGAEATAEMTLFFPHRGWLCTAENCTHTMHNLIPFRGAQARNTLAWSKYIGEALEMFGAESSLMFASHHWPRWGNAEVVDFLECQRDLYRWMHDQTMRYVNKGMVATEIAEILELPSDFSENSHTRGYYGALVHNIKAIYQFYLSWYDCNPAHLWPHPPAEAGIRYVEFMGGADALLAKAQASFDKGDYRWVAEVVNHLVFADPDNLAARNLQADALEQLGYQSEAATWRNAYLTGAKELRLGQPAVRKVGKRSVVGAITLEQMVDLMGTRLDSDGVAGASVKINITIRDSEESGLIGLKHRALHFVADRIDEAADCSLRISRATLGDLVTGEIAVKQIAEHRDIEVSGSLEALHAIFDNLEQPAGGFGIVIP